MSVATGIDGLLTVSLKRIADERGAVYHMLRATDSHFVQFGEIYFSSVYRGVVKAWKNHTSLTTNYACISGRVLIVAFDDRVDSPTRGGLVEVDVSPDDNYALVVVPPGVWHGFQGLADPISILANCATEPHDPAELDRCDLHDPRVPYAWRDLQ
jgi:dTDP-4-dehydrorhamnose 3,5-epimerase